MSPPPSPIEGHGLLGDTRTAALVDDHGSIDWLCLPRFDGEPVFAALVAGDTGGHFRLGPADADAELVDRRYLPSTVLLETTWRCHQATLTLTEGMISEVARTMLPDLCLVRRIEVRGAAARVSLSFDPRWGDERRPYKPRADRWGLVSEARGTALWLACDPPTVVALDAPTEVELAPGQSLTVVLTAAHRRPLTFVGPQDAWQALLDDGERWRQWCEQISYDGRAADAVQRSLLTLRLLTYSPSGAPVAAPTTSLPEWPGGVRNWDYRYAWPRDASIGLAAFLGVGLVDEARAFLWWLLHATRLDRPRLPPVLTIHGRPVPDERELSWPGFVGSRPVRVGNGARSQHQLDTYGWVLDAMWLLVRDGHRLDGETWRAARALADEVVRRWAEPDAGIWEVRGPPEHHVHSKFMAWLALDRTLCIAGVLGASDRRRRRWSVARDAIAADVRAKGFDTEAMTYVRTYGGHDLDAAALVLPLLGMEAAGSPRVRGTIAAIRDGLSAGGPLIHRYVPGNDGLPGSEGAFLPCAFWLIQGLAAIGEIDEATERFDGLIQLGGSLGLYAEEVDPTNGRQLGNYPQALTHASLIQAALALRDAADNEITKGEAAGRG